MVEGKIQTFYKGMLSEHHRYRSWEHCYGYFRKSQAEGVLADLDQSALQLGFYPNQAILAKMRQTQGIPAPGAPYSTTQPSSSTTQQQSKGIVRKIFDWLFG